MKPYRERSTSGGWNVGYRLDDEESRQLEVLMSPKPTETPDTPPPAESPADPFEGLVRGRVVHYHPTPYESRYADPGPWASIVTSVESSEGRVTLNVMPPVPTPIGTDPVARRTEVPYSEDKAPGTWCWMFAGQATRYRSDPPSALPEMKG